MTLALAIAAWCTYSAGALELLRRAARRREHAERTTT